MLFYITVYFINWFPQKPDPSVEFEKISYNPLSFLVCYKRKLIRIYFLFSVNLVLQGRYTILRTLITLSPYKVKFSIRHLFELYLFIFIGGMHQLLLLEADLGLLQHPRWIIL